MSSTRVCQICTSKKKTVFACPYCHYESCLACNERVILESINPPACTSCRKPFSTDFLHDTFSAAFLHTRYKQHRQNLLFEREKALLPSTQVAAEQERQRMDRERNMRAARIRLAELRREMRSLRHQLSTMEWRERQYQNVSSSSSSSSLIVHVAACPMADCRGFVEREGWKCGLCHTRICEKCREVIPTSSTDRDVGLSPPPPLPDQDDHDHQDEEMGDEKEDTHHVCNPDTVATIRELAHTTKPCPNCQVPIFKVNGCDQMFCVKCNVAFSWNTGEIERGVIHNPHYYEYLRNQPGGIPRNPNEERNGGMPPAYFLMDLLDGSFEITRMYRRVNHIRMVYLRNAPTPFDNVTHRDLRIQYLLQQITEDEFKDKLQRREKERSKNMEEREILEMYCNVTQDLLQDLYRHGEVHLPTTDQRVWSGEMANLVIEQELSVRRMSIEAYEKMNRKYQSRLACPLKDV